jgi:hypothetical protein
MTEIVSVVSALPSASVPAPRTLSESLLSKLADVADHHDGRIALHGRLFSQWLHFVYPRECPYPHSAGTAEQLTAEEWLDMTGERGDIPRSKMPDYFASLSWSSSDGSSHEGCAEDLCTAMWVVEEELVDERHGRASAFAPSSLASTVVSAMRACAVLVAIVSFIMVLLEAAQKASSQGLAQRGHKEVFV